MSIAKQFEKNGIELTEDNSLPQGQRTQRNVKRIIAAVRAAEAQFVDEVQAANGRCREAQDKVIALQQHTRSLEIELQKLKLKERLESVPSLSVVDKKMLIEA